jgi:hypothetical protein
MDSHSWNQGLQYILKLHESGVPYIKHSWLYFYVYLKNAWVTDCSDNKNVRYWASFERDVSHEGKIIC